MDTAAPPVRSRRRWYLALAAALIGFCVVAIVVASRADPADVEPEFDATNIPVGGLAPAIDAAGWINSPPLEQSDLEGKVVLYDFWTYSCVNCVRSIPHIQELADRYGSDGLVVIGVHSPEFDFEKSESNVEDAVQRLDVTYPVALDPQLRIWSAFDNRYWPARYIVDQDGHFRYVREGEGGYEETETVIRSLLGIAASAPRAGEADSTEVPFTGLVNPETYLGTQRTTADITLGPRDYPAVDTVGSMQVALSGSWIAAPEYIEAADAGAAIVLGVSAKEVNLVMAPAVDGARQVEVQLDGAPIPAAQRGASIVEAPDGRTVVDVTTPDMYRLFTSTAIENHELRVIADRAGVQAYAFTFG